MMRVATILLLGVSFVAADVYMHNPRGSNDRNCERNVNRNNGNRLFDSQNNAKGGYACPRPVGGPETIKLADPRDAVNFQQTETDTAYLEKMYYLVGSKLPIEWTAQHGCGGNAKEHCDIVIQYACEDTLDPTRSYDAEAPGTLKRWIGTPRDGQPTDAADAATNTIPDDAGAAIANTEENRRYGMHENQAYYADCRERSRNRGLFTADQNVRRNDARGTRQNPNGNRNGLECPEERDHYPYWHPNPWVDIAILQDHAPGNAALQAEWCNYFKANSQLAGATTAPAGVCIPNPASTTENANQVENRKNNGQWYNNQGQCETAGHTWKNMPLGLDLDDPTQAALYAKLSAKDVDCQQGPASRINHLGNAAATSYDDASDATAMPHANNAARYVWTIPDHVNENCVLRVRYNISTDDYPAWAPDTETTTPRGTPGINADNNGEDDSPVTQDPYVYLNQESTKFLSLAVNTNQYGRTFQDRSYVFAIRKPTVAVENAIASGAKLMNLNVRGKRGNIVQTYPAVEYDFVPNNLNLQTGDMVHFQWTGSDYNPRRGCNNGEGGPPDPPTAANANQNSRADRSNIVDMVAFSDQYPSFDLYPQPYEETDEDASKRPNPTAADIASFSMFPDMATTMKMATINQERYMAPAAPCLTQQELEDINNNNVRENHPRNCAKLNAAETPYFDGLVVPMTKQKTFAYFSSRNNNFSNRDQTGRICVGATRAACDAGTMSPIPVAGRAAGAGAATGGAVAPVLADETFAFNEKDNDSMGDGEKEDCEEMSHFFDAGNEGSVVGLALGMLIAGVALTICCQCGLRYYYNKPMGIEDVCFGGASVSKAHKRPASMASGKAPPPPARPARHSWQKGNIGSSLPAPAGNSSASGNSPRRIPPAPVRGAASSQPAGGSAPPPPPRKANSMPVAQPASAGARRIPPPPPSRR